MLLKPSNTDCFSWGGYRGDQNLCVRNAFSKAYTLVDTISSATQAEDGC